MCDEKRRELQSNAAAVAEQVAMAVDAQNQNDAADEKAATSSAGYELESPELLEHALD